MKLSKKVINKIIKGVIQKSLNSSANSTSSMIYYQPKAPKLLKQFSKIDNDKQTF